MAKKVINVEIPAEKIDITEPVVEEVKVVADEKLTNKDILDAIENLKKVVENVKMQKLKEGKSIARYNYFIKQLGSRELRRRFA